MSQGFYHESLGYWQTNTAVSDELRATYPEGTVEVPLKPSSKHTFNGSEWVPPTQAELDAAAAFEVRSERDNILATVVDPLVSNPLRWAALTPEQQAAWATYRQALLDVPQQAGFPNNITWPTEPAGGS